MPLMLARVFYCACKRLESNTKKLFEIPAQSFQFPGLVPSLAHFYTFLYFSLEAKGRSFNVICIYNI